ncbi:type II toxin-antitoxin system RelB/DinJ family antitoxin [Ruminococcus albus]|uniref:Addiction module antitoxin, RelB/DinJ family n=1 Tax=Ruminococcus albus (strain ATCC 27210 / DSM 20455 / JCM 14654 / NCDO 2250 / 7) TaxID=697329 RepID=E6UK63_RUMA7|nr:type II toxin-antitoxin system RelB/DinJ family antitoxin [Ruminococcus albus]ADU24059.1 addiction module antitoxin, RelB/DinJ family [Ruminococcus albus 7 = DSM 20455]
MAEQVMIQVRMDSVLKDQALEVFDKMGIDMSTAVRMFFKATVRQQELPFSTNVAETKAPSLGEQLGDFYKNMVMYEASIADDENVVTVFPLEFGEIPVKMFVQLVTKVPAGKVARWEDIFEYLGMLYGMKVYEKPHRAMPYMDSDGNDIPYWRIVSVNGVLCDSRVRSRESQKEKLEREGIPIVQRGSIRNSYRVDNLKTHLFDFKSLKAIKSE